MSRKHPITVVKSAVSVRVRVPLDIVREQLGDLAAAAGPHLAAQIDAYVRAERLGYYPALDFFADRPEIDAGLVAAVEEVALLMCDYAKSKVRERLSPVFSQIRVQHVQALALTLPAIRPSQPDALALLADHCTPTLVRLDLTLSSLERVDDPKGLERLAAQKVARSLAESFDTVEITDARLVSG